MDRFLETFDQSSIETFRAFVRRHAAVSRWFVSCDFCLHDETRPNDCFCFTIIPFDRPFDDLKTAIQGVLGRDIKNTRSVSANAIALLRDPQFFHIAVICPKDRDVLYDGPGSDPLEVARNVARLTLEGTVQMERGADQVARAGKLVQESKANAFNHVLLGDVFLLATLLPLVSLLIARERKADSIGWFSDRDSMTEWCDRIIWDFATENVHGLAAKNGIDVDGTAFPVAIPDPDSGEMWFDHLVRLSDYVAGTLAVWDVRKNVVPTTPKSDKFLRVVEDVIADSDNMIVLGLDIGASGLQWRRIAVSRSEPEESVTVA